MSSLLGGAPGPDGRSRRSTGEERPALPQGGDVSSTQPRTVPNWFGSTAASRGFRGSVSHIQQRATGPGARAWRYRRRGAVLGIFGFLLALASSGSDDEDGGHRAFR